jgi:hypothetical protein
VPALSKLSLAAQVAGSDLDTMARALFMFERNLGEGTAKFQEGLERIGLTMDEVKAAGPDEWLGMIADHLKGIEDPSQRAAAAMELFGRQGREIIPTLMKLDDALKTTNDIQAWTPEQAKEAEQFEMQMKSILIHAEALATGLGRDLMPAVSTLAGWFTTSAPYIKDWLGGVTGVAPAVSNIADAWGLASAAIDMFRGRASDLPKITGDAAKGVEAWRVAALGRVAVPLALTLDEETRIAKGLDDAVKANIATTTKWQAVLDELDDTTFKLAMDHQKQWRDEIAKTLDARNKAVVDGLTETQKAESALADFTAKTSLDTLNYQILKIWQRVDEEEKAFKGSEQQRGQYNAAVEALATAQAQALRDASDSTIIAAAKAADATEASAARQIRAIAGVTKGYWAEVDAAFAAMAAASGGLMSSSGTRVGTPNDGSMERGPGINQGFTVPVNGIGINSQSAIYQIPGRAGGGPVSGGQPYVVGERGAELFIPSSAGTMVPHGGGGAGMVINLSVPISVSTVTPGDARASEQLRQLVEQVVIDTLKNRMHLGNA